MTQLAGTPGKMAIAAALRAARYAGSGAAAEAGVRKTGSESAGAGGGGGGGGGGGAVGAGAASGDALNRGPNQRDDQPLTHLHLSSL